MAGSVWRHVGKLAAIFAWMATSAEGVSYVVSSCKEFETIPTPMLDDTHIVITKDIICRSVSTTPSLSLYVAVPMVSWGERGNAKREKKRGKAIVIKFELIF